MSKQLKNLYLIITIIGFIGCNFFIFRDILTNQSRDLLRLINYTTYNNLEGLLSVDILSAGLGFGVFGYVETKRLGIKNWYWSILMIFLAGVGVAIPMFMYLRELKIQQLNLSSI